MKDSPKPAFNRHSPRLPGYDYAQPGAYFITIVTQGRSPLFGDILAGGMRLNPAGEMLAQVCDEMPHSLPGMGWGIYQIMPNHFHAIIELKNVGADPPNSHVGADLCVCPGQPRRVAPTDGQHTNAPTDAAQNRRLTLGDVVGRFKSLTTFRYMQGIRAGHYQPFITRLWQRNYYEHIIRDEKDYQSIFDYIISNPHNWEKDQEYPNQ